jgi:hypothetical protein
MNIQHKIRRLIERGQVKEASELVLSAYRSGAIDSRTAVKMMEGCKDGK